MKTITPSIPTKPSLQGIRPKNKLLNGIKRILLGLVITLVALCVIGATYQVIGTQSDKRNFPPPGQMVDVGGYRLHLYCAGPQGTSNPTVILETMSGGTSANWGWIQPEVAKVTRVCGYDRAGRGWSDPSPRPETLQQTVSDLHALLDKAGIRGPYVLAGHSIGGVYMRKYIADYPAGVMGLVLIDTAHPDQFVRYPALQAESDAYLRQSAIFPALARIGLFRFYFAVGGEIDFGDLPELQRGAVASFWSSPEYFASQRAEIIAGSTIWADARSLGSLGNLPLVVVTRGKDKPPFWDDLQDELAALSSDSIHITVPEATHASLAFNQKDAHEVSTVILQVVEAARSGLPLASK